MEDTSTKGGGRNGADGRAADTAPESGDNGPADSAGVPRLEQEIAVLARLLEGLSRRRLYPLERSHYLLLLQLAEGPGRIGDLSKTLALDATTVTRQVAAMEARGLVRREPDPEDRRSALVVQTDEGAACAAEMRATRARRIAVLVKDWDSGDIAQFAALMGRFNVAIYDRLDHPDDPPPQ